MDQQALKFRKIVMVGLMPDLPDVNLRDAKGVPLVLPAVFPVKVRAAFWIPQRPPYRRSEGRTEVADVKPFEREALRAGVLAEEVHEFQFPEMPSVEEIRRRLLPVWEGLVRATVGALRDVPIDLKPNPSLILGVAAAPAGDH